MTNAITRALRSARQITDTTVAAAHAVSSRRRHRTPTCIAGMRATTVDSPRFGCATEPASNHGSGTWLWPAGQIFTINRSLTRALLRRRDTSARISTVARIGDQLYATAPGEAFPEVTSRGAAGVRGHRRHARRAHRRSRAGSARLLLGSARWRVPGRSARPERLRQVQRRLRPGAGQRRTPRGTRARRSACRARRRPRPPSQTNPSAFAQPTIQFYPSRVEGTSHTVSLYGSARKAQAAGAPSTSIGSSVATPADNQIAWDFGDGTTTVRANSGRFDHTFPAPGTYDVKATVYDNLGNPYRWVQSVTIDPPLNADVDLVGAERRPRARAEGRSAAPAMSSPHTGPSRMAPRPTG